MVAGSQAGAVGMPAQATCRAHEEKRGRENHVSQPCIRTHGNRRTAILRIEIAADVRSKRNNRQTGFLPIALEETVAFVCADNVRQERTVCVPPFRSACFPPRLDGLALPRPARWFLLFLRRRSLCTHQCVFPCFEHFDFQHFPPVLKYVVQSRVVGGLVGQRF